MQTQWWLSDLWAMDKALAVSWVFWVVVSIVLHELGHGWAALRCGDETPRASGHMTGNPFVHMPPMAWVMFALVGITWGLMPVDPSRFRRSWHDAWVSFAGPLVNLLLFGALAVAGALWIRFAHGVGEPLYSNLATCFRVGVGLNAVLFMFNLVPVPPLDGSRILGTFSRPYREFISGQAGMVAGIVGLIALFTFLGDFIAEAGVRIGMGTMGALLGLLGGPAPSP